MTTAIACAEPSAYRRHALHDLARDWPETNCYVDLWIEVLSAMGCDPVASLGFTVTQDFEADQFTFFKQSAADLERLYGVIVQELAIYDELVDHLALQVSRGRLPLVEVDGFYLPDTKSISYNIEHTKTTIGVNRIDRAARRLTYFHNAGYFELSGADFDGLFRLLPEQRDVKDVLFPYVEFVKLPASPARPASIPNVIALMQHHLSNRPAANPITAYRAHFDAHAERLVRDTPAYFHKYTFNVLRQLGANHELLSAHLEWLRNAGVGGLDRAIAKTKEISSAAKAFQFQLARAAMRGTLAKQGASLERMADYYDTAFADLLVVFTTSDLRRAS